MTVVQAEGLTQISCMRSENDRVDNRNGISVRVEDSNSRKHHHFQPAYAGFPPASTGLKRSGVKSLMAALACGCVLALAPHAGFAQTLGLPRTVSADAQMLLEADTLVYDNDKRTVTAVGGVRIDYDGNRLVAQRVTYHRDSRRLVASGHVEIIERDGNRVFAEEIDITDDFHNGFVNALRVETTDKTYFAAESADREGGATTTFNNGVYTACEPCEERPDKAPIWRVKARKIIWDGKARTVRFENSRFEMFGFPIAFLPAFEVADPTVKRKSGLLTPGLTYNSDLGIGAIVPFYLALSDTYDATLQARYYTRQGFLGQAEWRQRFNNGQYNLKIAGIRQNDTSAFDPGSVDRGPAGSPNRYRGMVATKGDFAINSRWNAGWDLMLQSDKNFSRTYGIIGYDAPVQTSQLYLTGLGERNYFDLRAYHFKVQENILDGSPQARDGMQPWVLPSFDYSAISDQPVAGGELSFNVNSRAMYRNRLDVVGDPTLAPGAPGKHVSVIHGIGGTSGRLAAEAEWKRTWLSDAGLQITPLLHFQADSTYADHSTSSVQAIDAMAANLQVDAGTDNRSAFYRYMATIGLDLRWPLLFSMTSSSHVLEPVAQIFARPDEQYADRLGIPNEDSQSFVFDATTLFERDKFSGYDRIEGGTRANIGFRYSGSFANGWTTNAIVGQSYHLVGENSFAQPDLVNAGAYSGLETATSDYVGLIGFATPFGLSASVGARLDEQTLELRRSELRAGLNMSRGSISARYAFIQAQPLYGFADDRHEVTLGGRTKLRESWSIFGSGTYDLERSMVVHDAVGFSYDDDCFTYSMTFSQSHNRDTREAAQTIGFNISFRTIGDFGSSSLSSAQ